MNTTFRWIYGGEQVYVTGSFTNWKNHIILTKIGREFSTIIRLPPGIYIYKYIVDGEWKYSPAENTCTDENGNINNIMDTTNYNPNVSVQIMQNSTSNEKTIVSSIESQKDKHRIGVNEKTSLLVQKNNEKFAENEGEFDVQAQVCPQHLLDIYFLSVSF